MLKFHRLELQNFLSYGNNLTKLCLDFTKPHLIVGKNYDSIVDGQIDSNGAGKSTILNAICFAAYDETVTKMSKDKLINYINNKNMYVALVFEKDGMFYRVERFRKFKAKGDNGVRLYASEKLDDVLESGRADQDITLDSISNTNEKIQKVIGMPFAMFSRIVVFNARYESFMSLPTTHASKDNQRQILEELFGYAEISEKAEALKEIIKLDSAKRSMLVDTYHRTLQEIERQQSKIDSVLRHSDEWEAERTQSIKRLKDKIEEMSSVDLEAEEKLFEAIKNRQATLASLKQTKQIMVEAINRYAAAVRNRDNWNLENSKKLETLEEQLRLMEAIDTTLIEKYHSKLRDMTQQKKELDNASTSLEKEITALQRKLATAEGELAHINESSCPYCKQHYIANPEAKDALIQSIDCTKNSLEESKAELEQINKAIQSIEKKIAKLSSNPPEYTIEQARKNNDKIVSLEREISMRKEQKNPYENIEACSYGEGDILEIELQMQSLSDGGVSSENFGSYNELSAFKNTLERTKYALDEEFNKKNPYTKVADELLADKLEEPDTTQIDEITDEIEHKQFLLKLLTKKDSYVRKALLNKNLPLLNSRIKIYLSQLGLQHKVTFNEDMTATISHFNDLPFENLSAGQSARLNLALSLAFRDVLESRYGKVGFCILDEFLDNGLGNVGVHLAAKLVKKIAKESNTAMLVISHKDEVQNLFDEKIEIELKNGFSKILECDLLLPEDSTEDVED
jgi:DNA repair exonuclease SbcCD ATPase subunit